MAIFILQLAFKPERNERRLEIRPKHRDYLRSLREQSKLVTAGPWGDDSGALLVYQVADEAELRSILEADPYTPEDVYDIVQIKEWKPLFPLAI
ncbi:MAG TPA: YciI family protein [Actinopolymorphaceae bacterium]